jgi:hypothetical protein
MTMVVSFSPFTVMLGLQFSVLHLRRGRLAGAGSGFGYFSTAGEFTELMVPLMMG